jgi:4-amino-4-deoxy-L-arabinose transferase-like glycosyltransferase
VALKHSATPMKAPAKTTCPFIRRRALLLGTVIFLSYAYFYQAGGWNQNSRFDLVRAIIEQGTLRIDAYHENTQDKAFANGHWYSDKAPGLTLLAVPIAEAARPLLRAAGVDPASPAGLVAVSYFVTVFAVALPMAAACVCLFLIALRLGSDEGAATFAALALGLATPMWAYSTLFWGHSLVAACLLFGFACALKVRDREGSDLFWGLALGLTAGWATVTEYPAAPASAIIALLALTLVWKDGWPRRWRTAAGIAMGAGVCIAVLLIYQVVVFGSAFHPSYSYYPAGAFPWMKRGYLGLTYPRIDVALKLLFGCRRGLLFVAPVVFAAPFGLRWLWKQPGGRAPAAAAVAVAAYYFLFNASFLVWAGGWSYGPRYMAAGLPLLCVGLAPAWSSARSYCRMALVLATAWGGVFALMAVAVTAQPPDEFRCALFQLLWPSFWAGKVSQNGVSMLTVSEDLAGHGHAFNWGELVGLRGPASLLPLLALWGLAIVLWVRMNRVAQERQP